MDEQDLVVEAHEEHHVDHLLIKELKKMDPEDNRYDAKFAVLSTHVTHHIKEEEGKMFPQAEKAGLDWERLTKQVMERRQSLDQKPLWLMGVPVVFASETDCATRAVLSGRSGG
jgi:hemerythrin superfamily protein